MAELLENLLVLLNATGLQQRDQKLYTFLKKLTGGSEQLNGQVTIIAGNPVITSGVTGSGTIGSLAQWNTPSSITDVDAAGISAALDLL